MLSKWAQVVDHHTLTDRSVEGSLPVSEQGIFSSRFLGRIEMILKESSVNPVENPYSFQTIHPILPDYSEGNLSCFSMTKSADRHGAICCLWIFYDFLMCSHSQNTPLKTMARSFSRPRIKDTVKLWDYVQIQILGLEFCFSGQRFLKQVHIHIKNLREASTHRKLYPTKKNEHVP